MEWYYLRGKKRAGPITDKDFIKMYFTYNFGKNADSKIREGYTGK